MTENSSPGVLGIVEFLKIGDEINISPRNKTDVLSFVE
jgi:hypothetical protein